MHRFDGRHRPHPRPHIGKPARLQFEHREIGADQWVKAHETETIQIGMQRVVVQVDVVAVETKGRRDCLADERQREPETGTENNRIERFAGSVGKVYGLAVDGFEPWPRSDSSFRHQCQIILRLGQAGGEDVLVRLRSTKLLRAAAVLQHHLFHPRRDRLRRQHPSGLRGKTRESNVIRRDPGKELLQDIALATHGDADLHARCRQFACDFERAD